MTKPAPLGSEQFQAAVEQLRDGFAPALRLVAERVEAMRIAMRPLIDLYEQHPELFDPAGRDPELGSCHCLCGAHPDRPGVCTGRAQPGMAVLFRSPTVGDQHVQMCRNCHNARTGVEVEPDMGDLEAVTETCTCHCWVNHPGKQGVCNAASDSGCSLDDRPACLGCVNASR